MVFIDVKLNFIQFYFANCLMFCSVMVSVYPKREHGKCTKIMNKQSKLKLANIMKVFSGI